MQSNRNRDFLPEETPVKPPGSFRPLVGDRCEFNKARVDRGNDHGGIQLKNIIVPILSSKCKDQTSSSNLSGKIHEPGRSCSELTKRVSACVQKHQKNTPSASPRPESPPLNCKEADRAYWPVREIRDAIYGKVWYGRELKRSAMTSPTGSSSLWKVTTKEVAIKEMNITKIDERIKVDDRENPYQEIAAMQHLERENCSSSNALHRQISKDKLRDRVRDAVHDTNVMMPLDVLKNDTSIFCVMPFCDGGEMFGLLNDGGKKIFDEEEARYLFKQILNGIETLQRAGICHLDISLENLMITLDGRVVIIDFGGCIKIPYKDGKRCLIQPFTLPRGKPYYVSNEIILREKPFDGHAVDVWSLGPILHILIFGQKPWELAIATDDHFRCFSNGSFKEYTSQWDHGLSSDLIDLLHHMFLLDPKDRLSLEQVKNHPWVKNGSTSQPTFTRSSTLKQ